MGKLYHTHEVKEVFDEKLDRMVKDAVKDKELTGSKLGSVIEHVRLLQYFVDEVISEMEQADVKYEEEMAAWRAQQKGER